MTDDGVQPADTMRERAGGSRFKLWLFVEAHRLLVVGLLLAAVFVSLVVVGVVSPNAAALIRDADPIETAFQAFIGATVTGVTLVLTLNQLVLSQELGAVGDQRDRMNGAMQFRRDVESILDTPISPPEPASFLRALIDVTRNHAVTLRTAVDGDADGDFDERVTALADDIEDNADAVSGRLESAQFGTFDVISAALNFDYSWKIYSARRIRAEHAEALTDEQADALDALIDTLELFGPTREHFKTLYFQWELIDLSRVILSASIPALVAAVFMVLYYDTTAVAGTVLGIPLSIVVVSAGVAVALLPFLILLAYILRIATITKRTLSIGPFTLRRTRGQTEIGWD